MRALLFLALLAAPALAGDDGYEDPPAIQRYLAELQLGDSLEDVQRIYPPAQDWPSHIDPRGRVTRYRVERGYAKSFPLWTHAMLLGFKRGRLVDIHVIYNSSTVIRVFPVEVPTFKDGERGVEWRTSIQVLEKSLYKRID